MSFEAKFNQATRALEMNQEKSLIRSTDNRDLEIAVLKKKLSLLQHPSVRYQHVNGAPLVVDLQAELTACRLKLET